MPTPNQQPVTLRQIAAKAGVSSAAVSLALRNSPQVSLRLRQRVQKLADGMGYRPNPLLAAYQAQVRSLKPPKFQASIAWVSDHPDEGQWLRAWNKPLFDGAKSRAEALGFGLDLVWLPGIRKDDCEGNALRFQKVLLNRGIYGVILPHLERAHHAVLPWEGFAVACVGRPHRAVETSKHHVSTSVDHHLVAVDEYANMRMALTNLRKAGCRRIGLCLSAWKDTETDGLCSASYLRESSTWPAKERVPILFEDDEPKVIGWVRKHKLDAVVCCHSTVKRSVEKAGFKVPRNTRVAHLSIAPDVATWSGVDCLLAQVGSAAVDLVTAHLIRNDLGVPTCAKEVLIKGVWVEGAT